MSIYIISRKGQDFNKLDNLDNARDEAADLSAREQCDVQIVNGNPGEPRHLLETIPYA